MNDIQQIQLAFHDECLASFKKTYSFLRGKKVYVYGSGLYGTILARELVEFGCVDKGDMVAFINDFQHGFELDGLPVRSLDECDFSGEYCIVVAIKNRQAVLERLTNKGLKFFADGESGLGTTVLPLCDWKPGWDIWGVEKRIERFRELNLPEKEMVGFYSDEESIAVLNNRLELYKTGKRKLLEECPIAGEQYFADDILNIGEDEIFLDLGAFVGDSVMAFVKRTQGKYRKVIAFEPDHATFELLKRNTAKMHDVELVEAATGGSNGEVQFAEGLGSGSFISNSQGSRSVKLVKLDDFLHEPVTLVKLDIEGAELDTLRGMEGLLKKYRPKVAVCVYHKVEDLYVIPKYLREIVPEYRFKLRQHEIGITETVLYAF